VTDTGARYLDLAAGIAVNSLGHGDPDVLKAIADQAAKVVHVSNLYHNEHGGVLAGDLVKSLQVDGRWSNGGKVFFGNSGAEANEGWFCVIFFGFD
jgi:acetylornithine/succinyldiaminopimelate/putrescine aminotransferase